MSVSSTGSKYLMEGMPSILAAPIITRVLLPGVYTVLILNPFWYWLASVTLASVNLSINVVPYLLFILAVFIGVLIASLDKNIYYLYEGFVFWPPWLSRFFVNRHTARIHSLLQRAQSCEADEEYTECDLIWEKLLLYPIDDKGEPTALCPTLLGNVLAAYEEYPQTRYQMDSVFFWPRLWLLLDKETKREITFKWARADCWVYLSLITALAFLMYLCIFCLSWLGVLELTTFTKPVVPMHLALFQTLVLVLLLFANRFFYGRAIIYHIENGDAFKAAFDMYAPTLLKRMKLDMKIQDEFEKIWAYLQYLRTKCSKCGDHFPIGLKQCQKCGKQTTSSIQK